MITPAYAALSAKSPLVPYQLKRREPSSDEILIEIDFCGICHSDLHQINNDWKGSQYPMVPGHEIMGRVIKKGSSVTLHDIGSLVGVGCMVDSCKHCSECEADLEQFCANSVMTYGGTDAHGERTYGGYSRHIVVKEDFALKITHKDHLEGVAPLLCAGITTYSPLRTWKIEKGSKVGVVGLGGLGHMAVKIAHSFGAEVTVFTTSEKKAKEAQRLGASHVVLSTDSKQMSKVQKTFDFILDTVSASHDLNTYLGCLKRDGTHCLVGLPEVPPTIHPFMLVGQRRRLAGSLIGGIKETQEMLDYCASHKIVSDVEVIKPHQINEALARLERSDVKYRFVIDWRDESLKN